jgi:hypothetical protein
MVAPTEARGLPFITRARHRAEIRRQEGPRSRYLEQHSLPQLSDGGPIYLCPLSSVPFSGRCPVRACPGCKPDVETGGCLYLFYGRTKLDRSDIMFSYKLNEKKLHDLATVGQDQAVQSIAFYRALNEVRSNNTLGHCPSCGIGHTKGIYICDNQALCKDRQSFSETVLKTSFLAFAENQGTPQDVYLIARELPHFEDVAQTLHSNIWDLLGIDSSLLTALAETVTVV